jgi:hypothetical protein
VRETPRDCHEQHGAQGENQWHGSSDVLRGLLGIEIHADGRRHTADGDGNGVESAGGPESGLVLPTRQTHRARLTDPQERSASS